MKYGCNWCNHTRPCVVEYSGSNECKPDRCMISPEQAGAFELVEDHECEWERSEILDIELKAAQKNEEAPETIDNNRSDVISLIQSAIEDVEGCAEYESPGESTVGKLNAAIAKLRTCG